MTAPASLGEVCVLRGDLPQVACENNRYEPTNVLLLIRGGRGACSVRSLLGESRLKPESECKQSLNGRRADGSHSNHPSVIYIYSEKYLSTTKTLPPPSSLSYSHVSHHRPQLPALSTEYVPCQTAHRWLVAEEEEWRLYACMHVHS